MLHEVQILRDESCFDLPDWGRLWARDPNRHVFGTPEWNRLWWEEFGTDEDLLVLTLRQRDEIKAVVPLYRLEVRGRKILRFIGGVELTDYLGPICSPDDCPGVAETLVEWLDATDIEWDEFDAHCLPVPLGFSEFLVDHADRRGLTFTVDQEETSAVLVLPADWGSYLASLESKDRHELKRKRRRLARDHPDVSFRTATEKTLDADLKTFVEMHRGAEGHKGHFMGPEIATFFDRVARSFAKKGWLRLDLMEVGERAVASTYGFELENKLYLYNSAYEPDAARISPGLVLVSELVKASIERGTEIFDFLRGPERYKYQLGAEGVPLNNVRIVRTG